MDLARGQAACERSPRSGRDPDAKRPVFASLLLLETALNTISARQR